MYAVTLEDRAGAAGGWHDCNACPGVCPQRASSSSGQGRRGIELESMAGGLATLRRRPVAASWHDQASQIGVALGDEQRVEGVMERR